MDIGKKTITHHPEAKGELTVFESERLSTPSTWLLANVLVHIVPRRVAAHNTVQDHSAYVHDGEPEVRRALGRHLDFPDVLKINNVESWWTRELKSNIITNIADKRF